MKQTTKSILHSAFHLVLFGGVILLVASIRTTLPEGYPTAPMNPHDHANNAKDSGDVQRVAPVMLATTSKKSDTVVTSSPAHEAIKKSVQHEHLYRMLAAPNDPAYSSDWPLAKVNAPSAWDITTGNDQTIIAVIDSGFALNHDDLNNQWYLNDAESGLTQPGNLCWNGTAQNKSSNNCDDDNNGYVDDWRGWSFIMEDNNPQTGRQNSSGQGVRHGTQVASLAGATTNNGVGLASLAWSTKIMPLQALDDNGSGYTSDVTAAIYYAIDNGANVINLSLGAYTNDPALKLAIDYAIANDVVVVAASGNCGTGDNPDCSGQPVGAIAYPAAYPDVIAVGASTSTDQRASFSSYGQALDVMAPGNNLPVAASWSAANQTSLYTASLYGTSFASPFVASLAALIKSIRPATSVADVTALINATASKPSAMSGLFYTSQFGHGIIDADASLFIADTLNNSSTSTPVLMQAGSYLSEHTMPAGATLSSGCQKGDGACTIEIIGNTGHKRFLPYSQVTTGAAGWSWSSNSLDADLWAFRTRSGESVSTTPYYIFKKG